MAFGTASVGSAVAVEIVKANPQRVSVVITAQNETIYLGQTASIYTGGGPHLIADGVWSESSGGEKMYQGPYWAVSASSTATVLYWERTR